ncbi:MAG TPA: insulinase family protein [Arcobacter sp.]|nr:insulinase family protein [Arcobacter sp.]
MKTKKILLFISFFFLLQGNIMSATITSVNYQDKKIPLIFEKHPTLPIFNLQLIFKNSGYIQDKNKSGLTSLTSKILEEGTLKDGAVKFARKLENKAISIDIANGFETFVIEVSCLKSEYKTALKLLNDLLQNPNLTKATLDKLKKLQVSKLTQKENDFDYIAKLNLKKLVFKNTALENSSSGTIESIKNITIEDIKKNISNIYNLDNLIILAGGDVTLKEIKKSIIPILYNFKFKGATNSKKIKINKSVQNSIIKKDTKQAYIYFASDFNFDSKDINSYKAKVASFILGGSGFGSRLMEEIRVKRGLAYSAYGHILVNSTHSYFTGYLQTKLENQEEAKKLVSSIVKDFTKKGVTLKELESAKKFLLGSEPLKSETFSQRQNRAFNLFYKGLDQNYPKQELEMIQNLSIDDLNSFIKEHTELNQLSFSIVTK